MGIFLIFLGKGYLCRTFQALSSCKRADICDLYRFENILAPADAELHRIRCRVSEAAVESQTVGWYRVSDKAFICATSSATIPLFRLRWCIIEGFLDQLR